MMNNRMLGSWWVIWAGLFGLSVAACSNSSSECSGSSCTAGSGGAPVVKEDAGTGGSTVGCTSKCEGATPICLEASNKCVECTQKSHCTGMTPFCDTTTNTCVECQGTNDCTDATASICKSGLCQPCITNADCSHISGKSFCTNGTCVQCTAGNESACGSNSCDPSKKTCTTTPRGSVDICHPCKADSECIGGNPGDAATVTARCVPMTFNGSSHGSYCLPRVASGCSSPYSVPVTSLSVSGANAEDYCGINQVATTCEAVLDLIASKSCSLDGDCGGGSGGLCKTVGVLTNRCTIPCNGSSDCLKPPTAGNTCTPPTTPYCH